LNIIKKLESKFDIKFNLVKYDVSDLSTGHTIKNIIENSKEIISYYNNDFSYQINSVDEYIDFLFLKYLTLHEDCSNYIFEEYKDNFEKTISFAKKKLDSFNNRKIIKFLQNNYRLIFSYDQSSFLKEGIDSLTLNYFLKFNKGLINSGIVDYLIENRALFLFDNLEKIENILKSYDEEALKKLILKKENFSKIAEYRYRELCDYAIFCYKNDDIKLSKLIADKIYSYCMKKFDNLNDDEIYYLQSIMSEGLRVLKLTKSDYAAEFSNKLKKLSSKSNKYLNKNGKKIEFEISNEPYIEVIDKLEKKFNKYMFLSHEISEDTKLWEAYIEKINNNYKPTLMDFATTITKTNDYFTAGKLRMIDQSLFQCTTFSYYWTNDNDRIEELFNLIKEVVEIIYSQFEIEYEDKEIEKDIEAIKQAIISLKSENGNDYYRPGSVFYIISVLEKVLRKIYCKLNKNGYFLKTSVTLSTLIGNKNSNPNEKMLSLIGKHQIKWLRFYLLNDERNVGKNLRNRIAHFRDIRIGDISEPQVMKILWLFISTINSIMVNSVNHFEFEEDV